MNNQESFDDFKSMNDLGDYNTGGIEEKLREKRNHNHTDDFRENSSVEDKTKDDETENQGNNFNDTETNFNKVKRSLEQLINESPYKVKTQKESVSSQQVLPVRGQRSRVSLEKAYDILNRFLNSYNEKISKISRYSKTRFVFNKRKRDERVIRLIDESLKNIEDMTNYSNIVNLELNKKTDYHKSKKMEYLKKEQEIADYLSKSEIIINNEKVVYEKTSELKSKLSKKDDLYYVYTTQKETLENEMRELRSQLLIAKDEFNNLKVSIKRTNNFLESYENQKYNLKQLKMKLSYDRDYLKDIKSSYHETNELNFLDKINVSFNKSAINISALRLNNVNQQEKLFNHINHSYKNQYNLEKNISEEFENIENTMNEEINDLYDELSRNDDNQF